MFYVRSKKADVRQTISTETALFSCELELYNVMRQGAQHFHSSKFPNKLNKTSIPGDEVYISRPVDVCGFIKPFDTCNTTSPIKRCFLFNAYFRPVNQFGFYRERLLWVQRVDVFKFMVISKYTVTGFGN